MKNVLALCKNGPYELISNSGTSARGVAIIVKKNLFDSYTITYACPSYNALIVKFNLHNFLFQVACTYLDNDDNVPLIRSIESKVEKRIPTIWGGDFNTVLDLNPVPESNLDLRNRSTHPGPKVAIELARIRSELNLTDAYRFIRGEQESFTYVNLTGGSRIDFCLMTSHFNTIIRNTEHIKLSSLFDHHCVSISLNSKRKAKKRTILAELLDHRTCVRIIKFSNFIHKYELVRNNLNEDLLLDCNNLIQINGTISGIEHYLLSNTDMLLSEILDSSYLKFFRLIDKVKDVTSADVSDLIKPGLSLVLLLNAVKIDLLNVSGSWISARKERKNLLLNNLKLARLDPSNNSNLIIKLNNDLDVLNATESDLLNRISSNEDIFEETLSASHISNFLKANSNTKMSEILPQGDINELKQKVFSHYSNAFKEPTVCDERMSLMSFLNDVPLNELKKLNQIDKTSLLLKISKAELFKALDKIKENKSCGLDGISGKLLKKIVNLEPETFLNAFNDCYLNGSQLDKSLKTAYIRLIPKGGDPTNLKNWRPITLISNLNKLYCKIIYNRIEKIVDNLLGPSQYAYRRSKDISDVIFNLHEIISGIKNSNQKKLLLSLDFSAAFDSLNHNFIEEILNFFGFPSHFVKVVKNYLSDNLSCIVMDDNTYTDFFKVLRGTGQGNPLSCLIFILVIEILLIKLNHSPSLDRLDLNLFNNFTLKNRSFGFADDLNVLINDNESNLLNLNCILNDFGNMSNLKLNEKKTKLIPLGFNLCDRPDLEERIARLGFITCVNEIKILGHIICLKDESSAARNWSASLKKAYSIVNNISSLFLDTRSKVLVIKSFVLAQLCYTSRCFKPSNDTIEKIETLVYNFLNYGRDNFSRLNIFAPLDELGLGIPKIEDFCLSLLQKNCSRAVQCDQPWAQLLKANFKFGLIDRSRTRLVGSSYMNIMAEAVSNMALRYCAVSNNESPLFFNDYITDRANHMVFNGNPPKPINESPIIQENILSIKLKDLFHNNCKIKSKDMIEERLGYHINFNSFMNLRSVALQCPLTAKPSVRPHGSFMLYAKSINNSKKLRLDLYPSVSGECNTAKYYSNKLNLDLAQINLKFFDKVGRKKYIPERLKNFIFKFSRNRIKLGAQLSHFTQVERNCTHCATLHNLTYPETCSHVFFECEFYKELFTNTLNHYFDDYNFLNNPTKLLLGSFTENVSLNFLITLAASGVFYTFYSFILRKKKCLLSACIKAVPEIVKRCYAEDKKVRNFILREIDQNKLNNLRTEMSKI